ncbi:AAA family ATPase [Chitiniphilus purpureus]|uniref:AAA family ATPase n=1 Tax=Chitiniphilus purpureus TaxID=2981137 RepID=A0ABY6DRW9_9NEIS|nr:AAA family ATPase [Chitiniphilus sp. CD1]UXY17112.1 AAA family ATPase [Chitiniphilus sp. CD1]
MPLAPDTPVSGGRWSDQAAGLRALIARPGCRSVGLNGGRGGSGATTLAINLAAALAQRQRSVILLDEFEGLTNAAQRLRLTVRYGLEHALRREVALAQLLLPTAAGFAILPVAARPQLLASLNEREQQWLAAQFEATTGDADFLLLDTRPATGAGVPSLSLAADDVLIIVSNRAESITDAYATIKLLHTEYARREFRVLANRVRTLQEAELVFGRIREVAQQYLGNTVRLRLCGYVPEDDQLKRATRLGKTVLDAFPEAEASMAFRQLADSMLRWRRPAHSADSPADFVYRLVESSRILNDKLGQR